MAYYVAQVASAQPESPVGVGQTIAEFETEAEAAYLRGAGRAQGSGAAQAGVDGHRCVGGAAKVKRRRLP